MAFYAPTCSRFYQRVSSTVWNFMSRISVAIFEWDLNDVELLKRAKFGELKLAGISNPSPETVLKSISKQELAQHCRRKTRDVDVPLLSWKNYFHLYKTSLILWESQFFVKTRLKFWAQKSNTLNVCKTLMAFYCTRRHDPFKKEGFCCRFIGVVEVLPL